MMQKVLTNGGAATSLTKAQQYITVPDDAVVCIIGSYNRETVMLSKSILEGAPEPAVRVSSGEIFKDQFGITLNELREKPIKAAMMGGMEAISAEHSKLVTQKVTDSLQQPNALIFELPPNNVGEVNNFLLATEMLREKPKAVLIKMDPSDIAHQGDVLLDGIERARWKILQHEYRERFPWAEEYIVQDPKRVTVNFTPKRAPA